MFFMPSPDQCDLLCLDLPLAEKLRASRLGSERARRAAGLAAALGDPTRLEIAAALIEAEELCICDLAWIVERPQALVSHHARQLRERGLVSSRREGKMVLYALTDQGRELLQAVLMVEDTARV
jgi:ArsR family transcriptional regulator, lead/cadmium/zinc/bismuth-responsive transcriptional repressor